MKQGQFPEIIKLGDLNGQNGFKIDGENTGDHSGWSVSAAGDVNGDQCQDLLIGATQFYNSTGRCYLIFGSPNVGAQGIISLSDLNGLNGFKLDGENENDQSGTYVAGLGDLNGDRYDDLVISANQYGNSTGRTYVVFGAINIGSNGLIKLGELNGANGFKLDGENNGDICGKSVKLANINGDSYSDLIISAVGYPLGNHMGRTYVVFGSLDIGKSGLVNLTELNGINGFKLDGENNNDYSGISVDIAGDFNGDGHNDIIIGAYTTVGAQKGRTYVVYSEFKVSDDGIIRLASLNGTNGFKLNGENNNDHSGVSVNRIGDFNKDGYDDFIIGAPKYLGGNGKGRSYVIFGNFSIGNKTAISLSVLDGFNGFKLDGESKADSAASNTMVSDIGDINGDGYADLIIGADYYPAGGGVGRSYVVFGHSEIIEEGIFNLSSLNGVNGFKLDGENINDLSGRAVSGAGDLNGDGVSDLVIGAHSYPNGVARGRSYVIFGDIPPVLVNNTLPVYAGAVIPLTGIYLSAYDLNHDNNTLIFTPTNVSHGYFEAIDNSGVVLSNFTQLQLLENQIRFVHDGGAVPPSYNITVRSAGIAWVGPAPANISFTSLALKNNQLTINQGQTVILREDNLSAEGGSEDTLTFEISDLEQGRFELIVSPGEPITTFGQQNITDGIVCFIHNGATLAPAYNVIVRQASVNTIPQSAVIDFDAMPVLVNNRLVINQGQTLALTSEILSANHPGAMNNSELRFDISAMQHGQFSWIASPLNPLINFYQQNISDCLIQFTHDNSTVAPSYNVTVTDGRASSLPQAAQIDFDALPILVNNTLRINQGETILVTPDLLSATHSTGDESVLLFNVSDLAHGQFSWINSPNDPLMIFYQRNITDRQIQFVHDNSTQAPGYIITVTDGRTYSHPQAAQVDFDALPVLLNNQLRINQGDTVLMTPEFLSAMHPTGVDDSVLLFNLAAITHGQFYWRNSPVNSLFSFYQQNITDELIEFKHDNSTQAPAYQVSVTDGRTVSSWQSALIDFDAAPILLNNTLIINQGQMIRFTSATLSATHPGGDDQMLLFDVNNVQHGKFSVINKPDQEIMSFYQQNITNGLIQFSHDNSTIAPNYSVSVSDGRITLAPVAATIDFDITPILEINQLTINQGQSIILTEDNLHATQAGSLQGALTFIISDCQHGQFTGVDNQQPLLNFQQQNITDRRIQFIHDNSITAPSYRVSVSDGRITTEPSPATIAFDPAPILVNNQLTIGQDQTVTLTTANLLATHNGTAESTLEFIVSQVQNGGFIVPDGQKTSETGSNITFSQQQVLDQTILFYQQGSATPAYQVSVSDGRITLPPASANIIFNVKPILVKNQFLVSQGQATILTSDNLAATHAGELMEELQFLVSGTVSHGQFEKRSNPGIAILSFYQQDIMQQNIQFISDNSTQTPDCRIKVFDSSADLSSDTQESNIILVTQNNLHINQGETFTFSDTALKASSNQ
ncbi:MAG: FG-GAP repeat protein, partial [Proteobacteria bacterium]|nr:FG-GAP repeat protein [Pseudomonadota bacterium]